VKINKDEQIKNTQRERKCKEEKKEGQITKYRKKWIKIKKKHIQKKDMFLHKMFIQEVMG
jgi:hypothetical protein